MLDGLEHIDWHALSHAYGEADDVPGLLRDILSSDDERREQALTMLSLSLCHQGTVYSASAHAVPFLVALLTNDAATHNRTRPFKINWQRKWTGLRRPARQSIRA